MSNMPNRVFSQVGKIKLFLNYISYNYIMKTTELSRPKVYFTTELFLKIL